MLEVPRWVLALVVSSFAIFHAILGALSWTGYKSHWLLALSIAIYLITVGLSVSMQAGLKMSPVLGAFVASGAIATSIVADLGIADGQTGTYASWYVGAMGVLLGVLAVRGQYLMAWLSAGLVTAIVLRAAGLEGIGNAGVVGMAVLIAAGQATARSVARANREVDELQAKAVIQQEAMARSEAANAERQMRLQSVLTRALPALTYVVSKKGILDAEERGKARNLEAALRDDIRGRNLNSERVRTATTLARSRGVQVLLLDEGGLDSLTAPELEKVLEKVADAIDSVKTGKVVVRSPQAENWLVTVMATRPGTQTPDLWVKF